ncbi:hypothetical protein ACTXT7_003713 [Hymenolepis weldensis]
MALKANEIANDFDHSSTEILTNKKSSTLPFFMEQLEHVIAEDEKAISFKLNLLKWAIKADNMTMANNQSQCILLKSREIEMLNDVHERVKKWSENSPSAFQQRLEDRVVTLLKTALHLIEDVPTSASYAAFKQLVELLKDSNNCNENYETYQFKNISYEEKSDLIKKVWESISPTDHTISQKQVLTVAKTPKQLPPQNSAKESEKSVPKPAPKQNSKANNEETVSAGRKSFDHLHEKSVTVEPAGLLADLKAGSVSANVIRENFFAPKNDFRGPPRVHCLNGYQKEPLVSPHVPLDIEDNKTREENSDYDYAPEQNQNSQIPLTTGNQGNNASESMNDDDFGAESGKTIRTAFRYQIKKNSKSNTRNISSHKTKRQQAQLELSSSFTEPLKFLNFIVPSLAKLYAFQLAPSIIKLFIQKRECKKMFADIILLVVRYIHFLLFNPSSRDFFILSESDWRDF